MSVCAHFYLFLSLLCFRSVPGAQQQLRSVPRGGVNANTPTRSASSGAVSPASAAASSSSTSPSPVSYTRERKPNSSSPQTSSLRQQQTGKVFYVKPLSPQSSKVEAKLCHFILPWTNRPMYFRIIRSPIITPSLC